MPDEVVQKIHYARELDVDDVALDLERAALADTDNGPRPDDPEDEDDHGE